jgi:type IV pilus assembly protein PilE
MTATPSISAMPVKCRTERQFGFTLIEVMITIAIIEILTAIALPAYKNYVIRGKLVAGTNALANMRAQMEQYYQDNRTYATVSAPSIVTPCVANAVTAGNSNAFNVNCAAASDVPTATTYTLRATGTGTVAGAVYTIDQGNNMATVAFPTSWGAVPSNNGCWIMRKGDSC